MNTLNKKFEYLRLSITDRCNLRCNYCMPPQGIVNRSQQDILSFEEIVRLVDIFTTLAVDKIRLTGGEPLLRKGVIDLINSLINNTRIKEVYLTTNGILLPSYAVKLKEAGIKRINISLDTLKESKFRKITGSNSLSRVLDGIEKAKTVGFYPLKLNTVIMKGINDDEIIDFIDFAVSRGLILRFIEFMSVTPLWKKERVVPIDKIKDICRKNFRLKKIGSLDYGPALYYEIEKDGILGFISTDISNCIKCQRLRLSSSGELKVCLYEKNGIALKNILNSDYTNTEIRRVIEKRISIKEDCSYVDYGNSKIYMSSIGG